MCHIQNILKSLMKKKLRSPYDPKIRQHDEGYLLQQQLTYRDLFYWALLFNRKEMAKLFWELGEEPMSKSWTNSDKRFA